MGEWIEHKGDCYPAPCGTRVTLRRADGTEEFVTLRNAYELGQPVIEDGSYSYSAWHYALWPRDYAECFWDSRAIAYRLHDDGQSEAETRKARMDQFYKIASGKDHLIEETLKTRKPVSAPQKAGE